MKTRILPRIGWWPALLLVCFLAPLRSALTQGIPEPSLIFYGEVRNNIGGQNIRITSGDLVWAFQPEGGGQTLIVTTSLTNILDQFSYLMFVPCQTVVSGMEPSTNSLHMTDPPTTYSRLQVYLDGQLLYFSASGLESFALTRADRGRLEQLDLLMERVEFDSDGDGLPDWWEDLYFNGNGNPQDDSDDDGVSNEKEYKAGTNPTDPDSLFEFIAVDRKPDQTTEIQWSSISNKTYSLLRSSNLTGNPADFSVISTGILASPPVNTFVDSTVPVGSTQFYLLKVEP